MAIKVGRVVTYHEQLQVLKLLDPSVTWFCEVTLISNTLYLHLYLTNRHQTWQVGD